MSGRIGVAQRARLAGMGVVCMAAVLLGLHASWIQANIDHLRPVAAGDPAPYFSLPAIDERGAVTGDVVDSTSLVGKVVIVDFWATWCGPCRESLPALERVYQRHRDQGVTVVSVNTDDPRAGRAMFRAMNLSMPLYLDDGRVAERFKVTSLPHLVLIDRKGRVRHVHRGFMGERTLDRQVRALAAAR